MPGQPCAKHPKDITLLRCSRCDIPICLRCCVETPAGGRCRTCAGNGRVGAQGDVPVALRGFFAAVVVAIPAGWLLQQLPFVLICVPIYAWLVSEAALRVGRRGAGRAMEWAVGVAAAIGWLGGGALAGGAGSDAGWGIPVLGLVDAWTLGMTVVAVIIAVSRIRYW